MPGLAALSTEERAKLVQAVEAEIAPAFQKYLDGDEEVYPQSAHIALAHRL